MSKLFEPLAIGSVVARNRVMMAPAETCFSSSEGELTQRHEDYYLERAKGGVGILTLEAFAVNPAGRLQARQLGIWDDHFVLPLRALITKLKAQGCLVCVQLSHAGRQTSRKITGFEPVCPSEFVYRGGEKARELSVEEIGKVVQEFGDAARRAQEAGTDLIELHGSGGYLICQFLSPYTNKRTDQYGGDQSRRFRFLSEVVQKIREQVGNDYPLICRISGDEFVPGGLTVDDGKWIAGQLENLGIDAIHVYAGNGDSTVPYALPIKTIPPGCLVSLAYEIKKVVSVPVIAVGGICEPELAQEIVESGKADVVAMARALIADPEWPMKVQEGRAREINRCIRCNECIDRIFTGREMACLVNPSMGRERDYRITTSPQPRRVLVVGGGPAGMQAARVLALRGHRVTLAEKGMGLGGQLLLASQPPGKLDMKHLVDYLEYQIENLGVDVKLDYEVTAEQVVSLDPDVVFLATGSIPLAPELPGAQRENVVRAHDVLGGQVSVGDRVLVVGGGMVGAETAELLAERGKKVKIVEMLPRIATDVGATVRAFLTKQLSQKGVEILTETKVLQITRAGAVCQKGEHIFSVEADTIVLALGSQPDNRLWQALSGTGRAIFRVGDCVQVRKAVDALREAYEVAMAI
ncbi:MAG: FAD-dependent oxidoreductase [Dehalococcoidia bacterium]|nr:FAD-dependent oxidoreductase [Dehalococcoidia bacterium]